MNDSIRSRLKENGDIFKSALERIVEKYSKLDGSGMEVCLQSMTCRTEEGILPWDGVQTVDLMKSLKNKTDSWKQSVRGQNHFEDCMDLTQNSSDVSVSVETKLERSSLFESGVNNTELLLSSMSDSFDSNRVPNVEEEEQDEELEQTLSSHGSTLLDLYPSMLSQMGEAWRRQQVAEAASAVLRRYRRRGWYANGHKSYLNISTSSQTRSRPVHQGKTLSRSRCQATSVMEVSGSVSVQSSPEEVSLAMKCFPSDSYSPSSSLSPRSGAKTMAVHSLYAPQDGSPQPVCNNVAAAHSLFGPEDGRREQRWSHVLSLPSVQRSSPEKGARPELGVTFHLPCSPQTSGSPVQAPLTKQLAYCRVYKSCLELPKPGLRYPPSSSHQRELLAPPPRSPQRICLPNSSREPHFSSSPSPGWPRAGCRVLQRRRSFSGFQHEQLSTRRLIDLEFRKLYRHFVCGDQEASAVKAEAGPLRSKQLLSPTSSSSSTRSLAALALSPLWTRVGKRRRDSAQDISHESKRYREGGTDFLMSDRLHHHRHKLDSSLTVLARSPGSSSPTRPWGANLIGTAPKAVWGFGACPAFLSTRDKHDIDAERGVKSPVRVSSLANTRDWRTGGSPCLSRRQLYYNLE